MAERDMMIPVTQLSVQVPAVPESLKITGTDTRNPARNFKVPLNSLDAATRVKVAEQWATYFTGSIKRLRLVATEDGELPESEPPIQTIYSYGAGTEDSQEIKDLRTYKGILAQIVRIASTTSKHSKNQIKTLQKIQEITRHLEKEFVVDDLVEEEDEDYE